MSVKSSKTNAESWSWRSAKSLWL